MEPTHVTESTPLIDSPSLVEEGNTASTHKQPWKLTKRNAVKVCFATFASVVLLLAIGVIALYFTSKQPHILYKGGDINLSVTPIMEEDHAMMGVLLHFELRNENWFEIELESLHATLFYPVDAKERAGTGALEEIKFVKEVTKFDFPLTLDFDPRVNPTMIQDFIDCAVNRTPLNIRVILSIKFPFLPMTIKVEQQQKTDCQPQ